MDRFTRAAAVVSAVLIAAAAVSLDSAPTLAQDEGAPCSTGSDDVCQITTTCVARVVVFVVPILGIPVTRCVGWEETMSYWNPAPSSPSTPPTGSEPDDPQDPPGGA